MSNKFNLPKFEHKFKIMINGDETDLIYEGDFLYRRPNLGEKSSIDALRARMNGDLITISEDVGFYNEMVSWLRFTLKEFPDWWKESQYGANIWDANVIKEVFRNCMEFEAKWAKKTQSDDVTKEEIAGTVNEQPETVVSP